MKTRILISLLALPLALLAAPPAPSAIDQKATALEAQLNKALDTSPEAAKVMLELVDLYYKEGRVFGLVRVGERFTKAQSSHARHREVMVKLIDGLEVMARRDELITISREFLSRYPNTAEAIDVVQRLGDALIQKRKPLEAADAYRALWLHRSVAANRIAGQRASELYASAGNNRIRVRSAEIAESLLDKLPGGEFTLRSGLRAVNEYRSVSRWVESNAVIQKMFKKGGLPITRLIRHELFRLQAENYSSLNQWANAVTSFKQARAQGNGWLKDSPRQLHEKQISAMYNAAMKAAQILPEVNAFAARFPNETTRWSNYNFIANAYAREGDPMRAARSVAPALAHAGGHGSMAPNYVSWLMNKAGGELNNAKGTQMQTQTNLENARKDEKTKLDAFNKTKDPNAKKNAKTAYDNAVKARQALEAKLRTDTAAATAKQNTFTSLANEASRTLVAAVSQAKSPYHKIALRLALANNLYRSLLKNEAVALTHNRAAVKEAAIYTSWMGTHINDLLDRQTLNNQFRADVAMLLKQRRDHYLDSNYRNYLPGWVSARKGNKDHKVKAQYIAAELAKQNREPLIVAITHHSSSQNSPKKAVPVRDAAIKGLAQMSRNNQFHIIGTQRGTLYSYGKQDPERARQLGLMLLKVLPNDHTALQWVMQDNSNEENKAQAKVYAQRILRIPLKRGNSGLVRVLMQVAELNKDPALALAIYQWAIKAPIDTSYSDYVGDVLFKLNHKAQALDWWRRMSDANVTVGRYEERNCAERFLANGGNPPGPWREQADYRWPDLKHRVAALKITDILRLQGNVPAFAQAVQKLKATASETPFVGQDWRSVGYTWREYARNNKTYTESENPAHKGFKVLDEPAKLEVYKVMRGIRTYDESAYATCDLLMAGAMDKDPAMQRLLTLIRLTKTSGSQISIANHVNRWNQIRSYAQKAFEEKRYMESATLLTGILANINSVSKEYKDAGRSAVLRAHSRMGAVGLTIDENSPVAPLLQAALYLRLGDKDKALELYQGNAELFMEKRNDLPPDLLEFVCNHLMLRGEEASTQQVEDILRGWLVKFTESKEQSEDAKARMQLLLARNYFRSERYEVARVEYATVTNRYAKTPHAIEARFGMGETFMAQKVFDQAGMVFKELEENPDLQISIRAEFLGGLLMFRQDQREEAREKFQHILERVPNVELANRTLFSLSEIYGLEQRYLEQLNLLRTVGRLGQHSKRLHVPGQALSIVVHDRDLGVSRGQSSIPVVVTTKPGGDRELVRLRSSAGAGKGLFRGEIDTVLGEVKPGDRVLQITGRDVIESDYPADFKAQFRTVPLSDVEIRIAADGEFDVASSEIIDIEKETLTQQIEREQAEENADERVSQGRPASQVKPGNRIFLRVKDADRDRGDEADRLLVKLVANSGDQVQVELKETGAHTGVFKAAIATAELPAGASATDSAIDHNPLMAIDHSTESYWQSEPNGETPKHLTVDMKHLHGVSRVRIDTPNATENAPVRGVVQGSEDGVYWFNLAAHPAIPRAEPVAEAFGPMTQRVFAGDHTGLKTWAQIAALASTGKPAIEGAAVNLKWSLEKDAAGAGQPHAVIWHGKLVQPDSAAMRFSVAGTVTAVAVNGRLELPPGEGGRTVDVWLEKGLHDIAIFAAAKTATEGVSVTRARSERSGANATLVPFNEEDFDLEKAKKTLPAVAPVGKQPLVIQSQAAQFAFTKKTETFGLVDGAKPEDPKLVSNWAAPEDKLQWKFNAAQSGVYEVWLRLAHNGGGSRYRVQFADQVIEAATPNTGNWSTYQQVKIGAVHIDAAGEKEIEIAPVEIAGGALMVLSGVELRPAQTESVILRDREWEFFFDPVKLRYVRFQVDEYLGDSVAVNHVEVRGSENAAIIPTEEDVSLLATNETLEIAGGDVVTASYTDETAVVTQGGSRLLTAQLTATYFDAQVVPVTFDFTRDAGGAVQQTRKELLRVDAGERVTFEVVDYDMDQTDERDTVKVQVLRNGVVWKELTATETEEYSGVFVAEVETTDKEEEGKLLVEPGDRVECVYLDLQNTFPGHEKERKSMVLGNEPTEGAIRIIGTQLRQPPPESEARPAPVYLPAQEGDLPEDHKVGVSYHMPLTVEVIDPDAAKDSLSTVKVLLNAGTTNEVEVTCVLSTAFGEFPPNESDNRQGDPALWMGRFIGQVRMQLGGANSAPQIPRVLGESMSTVGRARPAPKKGEEEDEEEAAPGDNLLITVLNLTGKDTITAKYHDGVRPDEGQEDLEDLARLVTDGSIAITDEGYEEPVEQLHVGEKLFVVVTDPDLDTSDERDQATVVIKSESGEEEEVKLEETLSHSGVFTGSFALKAREQPQAKNFDPETSLIECFFGDKLAVNYRDEAAGTEEGFAELLQEMVVAIGTDGLVAAFSKIFGNQQLAVETQFHIAESYFELFKNNRKLERKDETGRALKSGRRVLNEIMVDFPDPKYLPRIAYLSGQFSQELKDWNEAANSYQIIVRQYPNHTLASDAQYKLAHCFEEAGDFDRALEEYVTLAATYPKSPLIPKTMVRINDYFYKRENYIVAAKVAEKFMDRFADNELASRMGFRWGQCHFKAEQFAKAAEVFDLFAKKFPDDPLCSEALFWAGESYRSANNVAFAFRRYNRCRWDHPESEAAKYARGRLSLPEMLAQFEQEASSLDDDN